MSPSVALALSNVRAGEHRGACHCWPHLACREMPRDSNEHEGWSRYQAEQLDQRINELVRAQSRANPMHP